MNPIKYAVMLSISLIIAGILMPTGLAAIASATLTGVNASVATIFTVVLPILAILGLALAYMPEELKEKIGL